MSLKEYENTYKQLEITFDSYKGESFYMDKVQAQVEILCEKGLLKIDEGASIVDLSEYNMPPCLILKKDGSTIYPARDIAAAVYRKQTYDFDKCIYVTSSAQSLHFAQWFKVVELMGYDWYNELVHVPYGTVSIDGAKLATRTGNVVLLKDLFRQSVEKVSEIMNEKNPDLENKEDVAEAVGVGAIVFNYLYNSRIKDINFTLDQALSFEGNTATLRTVHLRENLQHHLKGKRSRNKGRRRKLNSQERRRTAQNSLSVPGKGSDCDKGLRTVRYHALYH